MSVVEIPTVSNVAAGARFAIEFPVGGRIYEDSILELTNIVAAQMTNISLEINTKPVQQFDDLAQLKLLNDYYGRDDDTGSGIHVLYFTRPEWLEDWKRLTAIGTKDVATMVLRGTLDGAVVNPAIKCHSNFYTAPGNPAEMLGAITKIRSFSASFATAGKHEISKLPEGPRIIAMHLQKADIDDVEVELDGQKVYDASKTISENLQKREARVPQTASMTHVDFMLRGDPLDALFTKGLADFRLRMDLTTAGNATPMIEYLDGFAGI